MATRPRKAKVPTPPASPAPVGALTDEQKANRDSAACLLAGLKHLEQSLADNDARLTTRENEAIRDTCRLTTTGQAVARARTFEAAAAQLRQDRASLETLHSVLARRLASLAKQCPADLLAVYRRVLSQRTAELANSQVGNAALSREIEELKALIKELEACAGPPTPPPPPPAKPPTIQAEAAKTRR